MAATATVSSKFEVTIPNEVRDRIGLRPGQKVAFIATLAGMLMVRVPTREEIVGMARGADPRGYRDRDDRF